MEESRAAVWRWLVLGKGQKYHGVGLVIDQTAQPTVYRNSLGAPTIEVHSVRTALRRDSLGQTVTDIVVEVTQRRRGYFSEQTQKEMDLSEKPIPSRKDGDFKFRAGCTIIIDGAKNTFRHIIRTHGSIADMTNSNSCASTSLAKPTPISTHSMDADNVASPNHVRGGSMNRSRCCIVIRRIDLGQENTKASQEGG